MKKVLILTSLVIFGGLYSVNAQERKAEEIRKENVKLNPEAKPVTIENRVGAERKSSGAPTEQTAPAEAPKEAPKKEGAPKTSVKEAPAAKSEPVAPAPKKEAPKK